MNAANNESGKPAIPVLTAEDFARIANAPDRLSRNFLLVAILDGKLAALRPHGHASSRPIIVGGTAVEFWSSGGYTTQDVDLVIFNRTEVDAILAASGFIKNNRYWTLPGSDVMIEFPGKTLTYAEKGAYERVVAITVDGGGEAMVIGIEDIIVDRVCSGVFDKIPNQLKWATEMALGHRTFINWQAIAELASDQGAEVTAILQNIRATTAISKPTQL